MDATPKKTYTVTLTAQCTVVIEADSEEEAGNVAMIDTPLHKFQIETGDQIRELEPIEVERHMRHADHFIPA
ncbi:hypothetical protein AABC73_15080 [Pseudomonas sp. G.S.17]|uniref:hypothetical protein n=1 Tax=Pseudomonas sp. G.S.17 TaxID=3137451 RepID=UPI00311C900A